MREAIGGGMSELLVAVVRDVHVDPVLEALTQAGHRATGLRSFGGFFRQDSSTLILAVEDEERQDVIDIFERICVGEEVEVPLFLQDRIQDWREATVQHAGATIFILPLAGIVRT
jgi:uncharacterized protein YaaQ